MKPEFSKDWYWEYRKEKYKEIRDSNNGKLVKSEKDEVNSYIHKMYNEEREKMFEWYREQHILTKWNRKKYVDMFNACWWDVNCCQKCGSNFHPQIHHINKNHYDNHPLNLVMLCLKCHTMAHKWDRVYKLMKSRYEFLSWNKL